MALIQNTGQSPDGSTHAIPIAGVAASTTTPLAANAKWDSGIQSYNGNESAHFSIQADQIGSYMIEYYKDGTKINFTGQATPYDPAVVSAFQGALSGKGTAFKLIYTNGSVAQTQFYAEIRFADITQETLRSIGIPMSATNLGSSAHSVIEGRESGTGNYKQATATTNGSKIGLDVNVLNPSGDNSGLAQDATLTGGTQRTIIVNGNNQILGSNANPVSVSVTNQPTTQPVSVSALPLPTGASTGALQTTGNTSLANIDNDLGALNDAQATNSTGSASVIALLKGNLQRPSTGVTTTVNTTSGSTVLLAANPNRKGATIFSTNGAILVNLGATSSATLFTARLITNGYYEIPFGYTGVISATGAGNVTVTELT